MGVSEPGPSAASPSLLWFSSSEVATAECAVWSQEAVGS